MTVRPHIGQVEPPVSFPPPIRPRQVTVGDLTTTEAALLCDLIRTGRNDPDNWTRDERAAVNRLFAVRDGRPRAVTPEATR